MEDSILPQSCDARVWAKEFVRIITDNPSIPLDEATMTTWFANAIMAGYDFRERKTPEYQEMLKRVLES